MPIKDGVRYFGRQPIEVEKVKVRALRVSTTNTPRGIFHFDPKGRDPRARENTIPKDVAELLQEQQKVKIISGPIEPAVVGETIEQYALDRRARSAKIEDAALGEGAGLTGADTRDTTAFDRDPAEVARTADGIEVITDNTADEDGDAEEADVDYSQFDANRDANEQTSGDDAPPADEDEAVAPAPAEPAPATAGRRKAAKPS